MSKLEAPTSLVINSMENIELPGECICNVNITFNNNGKLEGATYGTLRVSDTNDNSKAQYDSYNSNVKIEKGENTRTASITNFKAVSRKKYYFFTSFFYNYSTTFIEDPSITGYILSLLRQGFPLLFSAFLSRIQVNFIDKGLAVFSSWIFYCAVRFTMHLLSKKVKNLIIRVKV